MSNKLIDLNFNIKLNVEEVIPREYNCIHQATLRYKDILLEKLMPIINYYQLNSEDIHNELKCSYQVGSFSKIMTLSCNTVNKWFSHVCHILLDLTHIDDDLYDMTLLPIEFKEKLCYNIVRNYNIEVSIWMIRTIINELVRLNQTYLIVNLIEANDYSLLLK